MIVHVFVDSYSGTTRTKFWTVSRRLRKPPWIRPWMWLRQTHRPNACAPRVNLRQYNSYSIMSKPRPLVWRSLPILRVREIGRLRQTTRPPQSPYVLSAKWSSASGCRCRHGLLIAGLIDAAIAADPTTTNGRVCVCVVDQKRAHPPTLKNGLLACYIPFSIIFW